MDQLLKSYKSKYASGSISLPPPLPSAPPVWLGLIYVFQFLQTFCGSFISMLFSDSVLFGRISAIYFNFCTTLLRLFMQQILKAIQKSAQFYFSPTKKHDQNNSWTHLFSTSLTLLQLLIYLATIANLSTILFSSIQRQPLAL